MKRQSSEEEMLRAIARLGNASVDDDEEPEEEDEESEGEEEQKNSGKKRDKAARDKNKNKKKKKKNKKLKETDKAKAVKEESEEEEGDDDTEKMMEDAADTDDDDDDNDDDDEAAQAILELARGGAGEYDFGDDGDDDDEEEEEDDEGTGQPPVKKIKKDDAEAARIALLQKEERIKYRSHEFKLQLDALLKEKTIDYDAQTGIAKDLADLKKVLTKATSSSVPMWKTSTRASFTGSYALKTAVAGSTVDVAIVVPPGWITADRRINSWTSGLADALNKQLSRASGLSWVASIRTQKYFGGVQTVLLEAKQSVDKSEKTTHCSMRLIPVERTDAHNSAEAFVKRALEQCKSLRDTLLLVKIWMCQRGMLNVEQPDSLGGFATTLLLAGLAVSSPATQEMTSYQLFHHFLKYLATPVSASPSVISSEAKTLAQQRQLQQLSPLSSLTAAGGVFVAADAHKAKHVSRTETAVLIGPDGSTNYAAHMTVSSLNELTFFGRLSLEQLEANHTVESGFPELFLTPVRSELLYDVIISYPLPSGKDMATMQQRTAEVIREGIGDRCFLIRPVVTPVTEEAKQVVVGLVLNHETAFRQVQKGAPADNVEESRKFRALWGEKAEVRSFQDTSVLNCVVFQAPESQRHTIVRDMTLFLIERNLDVPRASIQVTGTELDVALPGEDEQLTARLIRDFDSLAKRLCAMELPLRIQEVVPACSALRFTSVCIPKPVVRGLSDADFEDTYVPALHGVIHFEGSNSWPDDIDAFRSVKTALLVAIAGVLRSKYLIDAFPYPDHIDIVFKGSVFSLAVHHHREAVLLQRAGRKAEAMELVREVMYKPVHHVMVRGVGMKYYAFNRTVRIAKRWICSHMLSSQISEEAIELLVVRVFTQSSPLPPPQSAVTGFARFLSLLCSLRNADPTVPVIVDSNGDMKAEEYAKLQAIRQDPSNRNFCPLMIVSSQSRGHSLWTSTKKPGMVGLKRIISVAEASASLVNRLVLTNTDQQSSSAWKVLFNPPLEPFSFTVHLKLEKLTRLSQNLDWHLPLWAHRLLRSRAEKAERLEKSTARLGDPLTKAPLVEFDPAECFCRELEKMLGRNALVFHNSLGGHVVGVVWNPTAFTPRRWSTQHPETASCNLMPITDVTSREARQFSLNVQQILSDVRVLGTGIIYDVRKQGQAPPIQEDPTLPAKSTPSS